MQTTRLLVRSPTAPIIASCVSSAVLVCTCTPSRNNGALFDLAANDWRPEWWDFLAHRCHHYLNQGGVSPTALSLRLSCRRSLGVGYSGNSPSRSHAAIALSWLMFACPCPKPSSDQWKQCCIGSNASSNDLMPEVRTETSCLVRPFEELWKHLSCQSMSTSELTRRGRPRTGRRIRFGPSQIFALAACGLILYLKHFEDKRDQLHRIPR